MNEANLVAAAKSGETEALDALYEAHAAKLFRTLCRVTRNREDAEDAVQDSFLRALLHLKSFDGRSSFATWLTRVGINSALMILRKKRCVPEIFAGCLALEETPWEVPDPAPSPEKWCADREQRRIFRTAVRDLRPKIRRVVELRTFQDRSIEQTAAEIGISVAAAKARLFHAKAALRKSKVLRNIRDRHCRQRFSNLQNQLQP